MRNLTRRPAGGGGTKRLWASSLLQERGALADWRFVIRDIGVDSVIGAWFLLTGMANGSTTLSALPGVIPWEPFERIHL